MLTIAPTTDIAYIDAIMHDPEVLNGVADDYFADPDSISVGAAIDKIKGVVLRINNDGVGQGWIWFVDKGNKIYEAHTAFLRTCRGSKAIKAAKMCVRWLFEHEPCDEIVSYALSDAPQVSLFARLVGLHPTRTEPYPMTRHGHKVNITWFSVLKPKFLSTQL